MSNLTAKNLFTKNAVLFKDMSIDIKRPKMLILMMIFNALVMTVVAGFFVYILIAGMEGEAIPYRSLAIMLIVLIAEEAGILFLVTPALTASTISGERERQTLDVLLTTRMTPFEIVMGKYLSAVTQGILLVVSTLPFLALVFIYGGLNFLQLLGLLAVMLYEIAFIAVFGVFFSALTKRTVVAVILSYVMLGMMVAGTLSAFGAIYGLVEVFNEEIHRSYSTLKFMPEFHADWAIFLLYVNPVVTIFDCVGAFLGVEIDDVAFKGMKTIVDLNYITGKNPLIIAWTPISMLIQAGIGFGFLKLAGVCLNPVKNNKKREREYERRNMKKVGVQPTFESEFTGMPMQGIIPSDNSEQTPENMEAEANTNTDTGVTVDTSVNVDTNVNVDTSVNADAFVNEAMQTGMGNEPVVPETGIPEMTVPEQVSQDVIQQ